MNRNLLIFALFIASPQVALAQNCIRIVCGQENHCEVTPSRMSAALPPGFEIRSIRGNTKIASSGDAALLDCRPASRLEAKVSADEASIYGSVRVTGKLVASGTIRFEPNDGGELEFRTGQETLNAGGVFFKTNFARIKLDEAKPSVKVVPPRHLASADCWQANATAELSDFAVVIGDTSSAGTYARQARIAQIGGFTQCVWGGK